MHQASTQYGTLLVGLGNPILGDDGVGWRVVEAVEAQLNGAEIDVAYLSLGGLSLMEQLIGYERVIIVDSIQTEGGAVGDVYQFDLEALPEPSTGHSTAAHDTSLQTALAIGRKLNANLPSYIKVVAIETHPSFDFSDELTPAIVAAIPEAARTVLSLASNRGDEMLIENKAIIQRWVDELINAQRIELIDELYAEEFTMHVNPYAGVGFASDFADNERMAVRHVSPGGPADGRLQPGDEIVRAQIGDQVLDSDDLINNFVWGHGPLGDAIYLTVLRNQQQIDVFVERALIDDAEVSGLTKMFFVDYFRRWPDIQCTIEFMIEEGDLVASRLQWRGWNADYDRQATWSETAIFRFEDGKIVESWTNEDLLSAYLQLGYMLAAPERAGVLGD
ncbi:MAG: hydrogenase maturation protease [Anaerolineae bacterium]|nr:hydrogenase maturation protease [Anaerolineae bacterium]MCO5193797.1 hydrogenase maturation protease [Anaerolineae bacterium]MCO5204657.1 hydrogenase maturation protease [Anaerolineae bacterium]